MKYRKDFRLESLEIARPRFRKFNSKYIESIKIARPRNTNFPQWEILTRGEHLQLIILPSEQ